MATTNGKRRDPGQDFMVNLPTRLHKKLQREAFRRSSRSGRKVHMTDIAREAIERELAEPRAT